MVHTLRFVAVTDRCRRSFLIFGLVIALVNCLCCISLVQAQQVHYRHRGDMPPGAIGQWQLQRGGPLPGYFQPTEVIVPQGSKLSLAVGLQFDEAGAALPAGSYVDCRGKGATLAATGYAPWKKHT